jgi:MFS family permease
VCPPHTTERKITTKIDMYIIPFVSILYLMAFLDRVNIGNARAFGLETELGMTGVQYNTALTIFFVPYIICEIPSNMLLKHFSPRVWLSICCIGFGAVTAFQGLVQNYAGLLVTRFFLGVFECGMFPGCFFLLSGWYRRHEAQKRFSLFFSSTSLAGAFGGLLASAIGNMDYVRGFRGWRWIFIIEGCFTVVLGVVFLFTFPSFPEQAVRIFLSFFVSACAGGLLTATDLAPRGRARVRQGAARRLGGPQRGRAQDHAEGRQGRPV